MASFFSRVHHTRTELVRAGVAAVLAALAALAAGVLLAGCGQRQPALVASAAGGADPAAPASSVPVLQPGQALVFAVDDSGEYHLLPDGDSRAWGGQVPAPRPFALQLMPLTLQALSGDSLLVATNRAALSRLDIKPEARGQRISLSAIPGDSDTFQNATLAPAWTNGGLAYFLLYRHPFADIPTVEAGRTASSPAAGRLPASDPGNSRILESDGTGLRTWPLYEHYLSLAPQDSGSLYALFPVSAGTWYVQYRHADDDGVSSTYARWSLDSKTQQLLSRAAFESALMPKALRQAPELLQRAALALGGDLILDTVLLDGSRQVYIHGDQSLAEEANAHIGIAGTCVVTATGKAVYAPHGSDSVRQLQLPRPVAELRYGQVAVLADVAVVLWEENLFPNVGRSGFIVLSLLD